MPVPAKMADLFTIASSNSPAGSEAIGNSLDDYLRAAFAILRSTNAIASASVASASTTNIGAADAEHVQVTGTATISSFGTSVSGLIRECRFTGSLTITASSNIVTPGGTDIAVVAGDVFTFRSMGGGVWRLVASTNVISLIADGALTIAKTSGLQTALNGKATSAQGAKADSAVQPNTSPTFAGTVVITGGSQAGGGHLDLMGGSDYKVRMASGLFFNASSSNWGFWNDADGAWDLQINMSTYAASFRGQVSAPAQRLTSTSDVSLSSSGHAFQIGPDNGPNLRMDSNEIMAANNGAASPLLMQQDGGGVVIGGGKSLSKITVSSSAPGTLQDGELYLEY